MTTLGIDFGTSNSSAAFFSDNAIIYVNDPSWHMNTIPSSVFALPSGELLIGRRAENRSLDAPDCYCQCVKCTLNLGESKITLGENAYQPDDLVAALLKRFKNLAEQELKSRKLANFTRVVLTVPVLYEPFKRDLMQRAAQKAGFAAAQISFIEEPIAAAQGYGHRNTVKQGEKVLVYDLGGGTFDVAILKYGKQEFQRCGSPDGLKWGGLEFDRLIYDDLVRQQKNTSQPVPNGNSKEALCVRIALLRRCQELKHELTEQSEDSFSFAFSNGKLLEYQLSRLQFYEMISPKVRKTIDCCYRALASAGLTWQEIDTVLLVGGSCRIPLISTQLRQQGVGKVVLAEDPELAVCRGAALPPKDPPKGGYPVLKNIWDI